MNERMRYYQNVPHSETRVAYRGRQTGGESFFFSNTALESYLYKSSEETLTRHGITREAQENWATNIANLRTPTVDCQGNPKVFANFYEFEVYLQTFYNSLVSSGRVLRQKRDPGLNRKTSKSEL